MHRVASNLRIFIGTIQSQSLDNGGVIREKDYMLRVGVIKRKNRSRWFLINIYHIFGIVATKCVTEMYQNISQQMENLSDNLLFHEELYPFI